MIKFSIPTNWQDDLLPNLRKDFAYEMYAQLAKDYIGGGRASCTIPHPSRKKASIHIKEIHSYNLKFNYLINATCLGNEEFTRRGQRKLSKLLDWLTDIGVDSLTISIPYLLELIKKRYPNFKVSVSGQVGVNTVRRAKFWEDLGADKITLGVIDVNRDFKLIEGIRKAVRCQLQLIANTPCLYGCPTYPYHANTTCHASQESHKSKGFFIDYCRLSCSYLQNKNLIDLIRGTWIRPEDIYHYEKAGIDFIKFVDRNMPSSLICLIVEAYSNRRYDGNLLDLFPNVTKNIKLQRLGLFHTLFYYFHPLKINIFKLRKKKELLNRSSTIYIDNNKLEGFISCFLEKSCYDVSCEECGHCEDYAKKAIKIMDKEAYKLLQNGYNKYREEIIDSSLFID